MTSKVVHMWLEWSCLSQFLRSCVLAGSPLGLRTKVRSPPAASVICQTTLAERVLMLFVSTVTSWVIPLVTVPKILNAASVRKMVIMPLIVACPGGVALPWLTLMFPLLCPILRTLLLMCLLPVLYLLLMFLNALRLFPRLSLCPMILLHNRLLMFRLLLFHFLHLLCSHRYCRHRRHRPLLVCLLLRILRCGLHSAQSTQDSSQQSADPSQLSQPQSFFESPEPPSAPFPVPSPPSSVITGTLTVSDLELAAEVLSQSPVTDEALAAMEISEVSPVVSPPPSQTSVRAFVSRVASKRKPARLDPPDGLPPRKSTTPLLVSSGRKT